MPVFMPSVEAMLICAVFCVRLTVSSIALRVSAIVMALAAARLAPPAVQAAGPGSAVAACALGDAACPRSLRVDGVRDHPGDFGDAGHGLAAVLDLFHGAARGIFDNGNLVADIFCRL